MKSECINSLEADYGALHSYTKGMQESWQVSQQRN